LLELSILGYLFKKWEKEKKGKKSKKWEGFRVKETNE
jgi:hypothetical protein